MEIIYEKIISAKLGYLYNIFPILSVSEIL